MARVQRLDFGSMGGPSRTPAGGLRVPAHVTRLGVLRYSDAAGQEWGELRCADEVFCPDSMASLRGVPTTVGHPGMVTAQNWKSVAVGPVGDDVGPREEFLDASVVIEDQAAVEQVESGKLVEVSCGYSCDISPEAGVHADGTPYQAIQRNIRYNHLALGPRGWGRAGADVSLRMDGNAVEVVAPPEHQTMKIIKLGGKEYRMDEADFSSFEKALAEIEAQAEKLGPQNQALEAEVGAMKVTLGQALAKVMELEGKLGGHPAHEAEEAVEEEKEGEPAAVVDEGQPTPVPPGTVAPPGSVPAVKPDSKGLQPDFAMSEQDMAEAEEDVPEPIKDSIAEKRIALWAVARKVLGPKATLKGKSAHQIHMDCLTARVPSLRLDGLSHSTVESMFSVLTATAPVNNALALAHADAAGVEGSVPVKPAPDADASFAKMKAASINAWKQPLKIGARS